MKGYTYFFRDITNIDILKDKTNQAIVNKNKKQSYIVIREICLSIEEYEYFMRHLNRTYSFIKEITHTLGFTQEYEYICVLVYSEGNKNQGILVNSQGYSYAKMSAMFKIKN